MQKFFKKRVGEMKHSLLFHLLQGNLKRYFLSLLITISGIFLKFIFYGALLIYFRLRVENPCLTHFETYFYYNMPLCTCHTFFSKFRIVYTSQQPQI